VKDSRRIANRLRSDKAKDKALAETRKYRVSILEIISLSIFSRYLQSVKIPTRSLTFPFLALLLIGLVVGFLLDTRRNSTPILSTSSLLPVSSSNLLSASPVDVFLSYTPSI